MPFENMVHSVISVPHPVLQCHDNSPAWKDSHFSGQDTKMYIWWHKVASPQISAPDSFTVGQHLPVAKASLDSTCRVPLWVQILRPGAAGWVVFGLPAAGVCREPLISFQHIVDCTQKVPTDVIYDHWTKLGDRVLSSSIKRGILSQPSQYIVRSKRVL